MQIAAIIALIIITPTRIMQWFNNFGLRIRGMGVKGWFLCILLVGTSDHHAGSVLELLICSLGITSSAFWLRWIHVTYWFYVRHLARIFNCFIRLYVGRGDRFLVSQSESCRILDRPEVADSQTFFPKVKMGTKWDAFGNVMKYKGLPLIIMIRYSPIPWAIGNGLFAVSQLYCVLTQANV